MCIRDRHCRTRLALARIARGPLRPRQRRIISSVDDPRLTRTTNATLLTLLLATALPAMLLAQDFSQTQTKPSPTAPLIQQANDALAAADLATAFRLLTTLNTQTPNNPQVLYDLSLIHI